MSDTPASGFGKFVPGFDFLQGLATQAAGGIAQGLGQKLPSLPSLGHWVAPTFSVEELDKRIEELRAVQFWLDQNAKALGATIQALEVQKMTLSTLKSMNFSMGDLASALQFKPGEGAAPSAPFPAFQVPPRAAEPEEPQAAPEPEAPAPAPAPRRAARRPAARKGAEAASPAPVPGGVVDPLQWWSALSQQFQQIATHALKDAAQQTALDATRQVAGSLTDAALKTASGMGRAAAATAQPVAGAKPRASAKSAKKTAPSTPAPAAARRSAAKTRSPRR